jgi:hypothetical protein
MSKFVDGYRDEETGKWKKGPSFSPPNLAFLIAQQIAKSALKEDAEQLELELNLNESNVPSNS